MTKRLDCSGFFRDLRMRPQLRLLEGAAVVHNGRTLAAPVAVVLRLENSGSDPLDPADLGGPPAVEITGGEWVAGGLVGDGTAETPVTVTVTAGATEIRLPAVPRAGGDRLTYLLVADLRAAAPTVRLAGRPLSLARPNSDYAMANAPLAGLTPANPDPRTSLIVGLEPLLLGGGESFMAGIDCARDRQKSVGSTLMSINLHEEEELTRSPITISWQGGTVAKHDASRPDYGSRHGVDQEVLVDATRAVVAGKRSVTIGSRALPGYPPLEADVLIKGDVTDVRLTGGETLSLEGMLQVFSLSAYLHGQLGYHRRQMIFSSNPARRLWQSATRRGRAKG